MDITDLTPDEQQLVLAHRARAREQAATSDDQPYTFLYRRAVLKRRQLDIERISLVLCKYALQFGAE